MDKKTQTESCSKSLEPSWKDSCSCSCSSTGFSNFNSSGFATFNSNSAKVQKKMGYGYKEYEEYEGSTSAIASDFRLGGYEKPVEQSWSKYFKSILQPKIQIVKNKSTQFVLTIYNCLSVLNSTFEYLTVNIWYDLYNDNDDQFNKIKYEIKNQIKNEMESGLLFKIQQTQQLRMSINKIDIFTKERIKYLDSNIIQLNRENHKLKYKIVLENILSCDFKKLKITTIDDYEKI